MGGNPRNRGRARIEGGEKGSKGEGMEKRSVPVKL